MEDAESPSGGLIITRRVGESFTVGEVFVRIIERRGNAVRVQVIAPEHLSIRRDDMRSTRPRTDHTESD